MSKHAATVEGMPGFEWYTKRSRVCMRFEGDITYPNGNVRRRNWCGHFSYADTAGRNYRSSRHSTDYQEYQAKKRKFLAVLAAEPIKGLPFRTPRSYLYFWVTEAEYRDLRDRWENSL